MENDELHQALDTCALELAYEKSLHEHDITHESEEYRRLRVQLLLLELDKDDLHAQIAEDDDYFRRAEVDQDALKERINQMEARLEKAQGELRMKAREIETLKAELNSLHGVTMDSTKLLTEKLTLARELSSIRPELDHLRQQAASIEKIQAEKLSLQHQLGTLQVKLDMEKKSTQRILAREGKAHTKDADIESQLQALQAELMRERREKQKSELEARQASNAWEAQKMALESRLESLRNKFRSTKDSLKESQQELQNARSMAKPTFDERVTSVHAKPTSANHRKRTATQMLSESMIGTPGDAANERRNKRPSALPGDKSMFSTTPYLNRTASIAPESPPGVTFSGPDVDDTAKIAAPAQDGAMLNPRTSEASVLEEQRSDKLPALGISKTSKSNMKVARRQDKGEVAARLEKVAEEEQTENAEISISRRHVVSSASEDQSTLRGGEAKKKKRKFLGGLSSTFFDEENRETFKPGMGPRVFGSLSKTTLGGPKSRPILASSTSGHGFGAFSPLKRNIRPSATGGA
ncbi:MAG: hypothetical protein Q9208_000422 [Pyrenodesmia sp. 3 TL-2023]